MDLQDHEYAPLIVGILLGVWMVVGLIILTVVACLRGTEAAMDFCRCWIFFWRPPECLDLLQQCMSSRGQHHTTSKDKSRKNQVSPDDNDIAGTLPRRKLSRRLTSNDVVGIGLYTRKNRSGIRLGTWAGVFSVLKRQETHAQNHVQESSKYTCNNDQSNENEVLQSSVSNQHDEIAMDNSFNVSEIQHTTDNVSKEIVLLNAETESLQERDDENICTSSEELNEQDHHAIQENCDVNIGHSRNELINSAQQITQVDLESSASVTVSNNKEAFNAQAHDKGFQVDFNNICNYEAVEKTEQVLTKPVKQKNKKIQTDQTELQLFSEVDTNTCDLVKHTKKKNKKNQTETTEFYFVSETLNNANFGKIKATRKKNKKSQTDPISFLKCDVQQFCPDLPEIRKETPIE